MANLFNALVIIGRISEIKECELNDNEINGNIRKKVIFTVTTTQMNYKTNKEEKTINKVVAYNKHAQLVSKYIKDNDLVCVEGKLNNTDVEKLIIVQRLTFLNTGNRHITYMQQKECDI